MEQRKDFDPKREEEHREHGRTDRPGQGPSGEKDRSEHGRMPGRDKDEPRREPGKREPQQPTSGRQDTPGKFGDRRDQPPAGKREQR